MKTKMLAVLFSLMIGGINLNAQEQKGHQNSAPAKNEKSSEMKDQAPAPCCQGMKDMSSCEGMQKKTKTDQAKEEKKATSAIIYTCPMHPEVQSDKPGKCPRCRMDLVKKS